MDKLADRRCTVSKALNTIMAGAKTHSHTMRHVTCQLRMGAVSAVQGGVRCWWGLQRLRERVLAGLARHQAIP
jgi:uncharacterized RmlC-like cupin family protein